MASANFVVLMGNLTRNPEVRYTSTGRAVTTLNLAVNRSYKDKDTGQWKEEADFFPVTVWGAQAENSGKYLSKGRGVYIEGRLVQSTWETPDGESRSRIEVVARTVQFLPGGSRGGESSSSSSRDDDVKEEKYEDLPDNGTPDNDPGDDEEIPF